MSDLIVAPLLLTWARGPRVAARPPMIAEAVALAAALVGGAVFLFDQLPEAVARRAILQPYLLFLPLIWAAVRFGARGAATGTFVVAATAIWGTTNGHGAFVRPDPADSLMRLHVFLASASIASLVLGAAVSERERSRRELREGELTLRTVVESTIDTVFVKDRLGRYLMVNPAGADLFGTSAEAVIGTDDEAWFPAVDARAIREVDCEVMRTGQSRSIDEVLTLAGTTRFFHTTKAPYRDHAGEVTGVLGIARDVTERVRAEQQRFEGEARRRLDAQAATRAKDEFLATLSHELRTPLQSMLGWTLVMRERRLDERTMQKGLASIERNVKTQAQLIEDLLDVSRIAAGKLHLEREPVDLGEVVAAAVESVKAASAKPIQLDVTTEPLDGIVLGDRDRLHQVVSNLLTNAVKFSPAGSRIGVRVAGAGGSARIVVTDTGRGISPELLPHVFDRFRQAESGTTRRHGGLGLGLAIVRHLVEMHEGTVQAESPGEGRGATFTVALPLVRAERQAVAADRWKLSAPEPSAAVSLLGVRVLVVDDDPDACELLQVVLRAAGAEVRTARSAGAAREALASFGPHLLLSDIGMPVEDGYDLIRQVRARESAEGGHVPAIALTAFASVADHEQALALGFEAHLAKPASPADLASTVANLVGRAR